MKDLRDVNISIRIDEIDNSKAEMNALRKIVPTERMKVRIDYPGGFAIYRYFKGKWFFKHREEDPTPARGYLEKYNEGQIYTVKNLLDLLIKHPELHEYGLTACGEYDAGLWADHTVAMCSIETNTYIDNAIEDYLNELDQMKEEYDRKRGCTNNRSDCRDMIAKKNKAKLIKNVRNIIDIHDTCIQIKSIDDAINKLNNDFKNIFNLNDAFEFVEITVKLDQIKEDLKLQRLKYIHEIKQYMNNIKDNSDEKICDVLEMIERDELRGIAASLKLFIAHYGDKYGIKFKNPIDHIEQIGSRIYDVVSEMGIVDGIEDIKSDMKK